MVGFSIRLNDVSMKQGAAAGLATLERLAVLTYTDTGCWHQQALSKKATVRPLPFYKRLSFDTFVLPNIATCVHQDVHV